MSVQTKRLTTTSRWMIFMVFVVEYGGWFVFFGGPWTGVSNEASLAAMASGDDARSVAVGYGIGRFVDGLVLCRLIFELIPLFFVLFYRSRFGFLTLVLTHLPIWLIGWVCGIQSVCGGEMSAIGSVLWFVLCGFPMICYACVRWQTTIPSPSIPPIPMESNPCSTT